VPRPVSGESQPSLTVRHRRPPAVTVLNCLQLETAVSQQLRCTRKPKDQAEHARRAKSPPEGRKAKPHGGSPDQPAAAWRLYKLPGPGFRPPATSHHQSRVSAEVYPSQLRPLCIPIARRFRKATGTTDRYGSSCRAHPSRDHALLKSIWPYAFNIANHKLVRRHSTLAVRSPLFIVGWHNPTVNAHCWKDETYRLKRPEGDQRHLR